MNYVTPGMHLKGWIETHWKEMSGSHADRNNYKNKYLQAEGNAQEARVVSLLVSRAHEKTS